MSASQKNNADQFYLCGTQINFNERTQYKDKKYGENRVMGSRPYSAVSDLNTYEKSTSLVTLCKRPFSADTVLCTDKKPFTNNNEEFHSVDIEQRDFYEIHPVKDCSNEPDLRSAQIFKSLISESVETCTWENTESNNLYNLDELSDISNSDSVKSLGRKIQEFSQNSPTDRGKLVPGIKTKPPLPTKLKVFSKYDAPLADPSSMFGKQQQLTDVFEFMSSGDKVFPEASMMNEALKATMMNDGSVTNDNYCYVEDLEESDKVEDCANENGDKTREQEDGVNSKRTLFRNWMAREENDNITEQTKQKEKQTDQELQNLQKQQQDLNENIYNMEHLLQTNKEKQESFHRRTNKESLRDVYTLAKNKANTKLGKVNRVVQLHSKENSHDTCTKKQPKSILKVAPKKNSATLSNAKKYPENIETGRNEAGQCTQQDVTSWMSANIPHENFLDFLNKLDDFENPADENIQTTVSRLNEQDINAEIVRENDNFDEITSILEVLEKEDLKSQKNIESMKEIMNSELANAAEIKSSDIRSGSTSSLASSISNYQDFLSYLDDIDESCVNSLKSAKERIRTVTKVNSATINIDKIPRLEELLNYSNVELAHYVADLTLRLKERSSAVSTLQSELMKVRNILTTKANELENTFKENLKTQKDDYEGIIKRHQKFIDQLIADKKSLNKQCEGLINEMKVLEDRYNTNIKTMEQRHKIEMQKAKDMHAAGEKLRREKWIEGKTQKIKEMTVKSLEPELQSMATRHQQELADQRLLHKRELEELELRAARKTQQQCEALRQQLTTERETAITHERDILRQRLEKLVESEERSYQEQRRRLNSEHAAKLAECEERIAAVVGERDRAIEAARVECENQLQTALRRHKVEMRNVRESTELEFEVWKNNFKKQQTIKLAETEAQMKEACKKDRDREIEMVIERLEQETNETREQIEQATENRLRRIKEKFEEEIKDLEMLLNEYKTKYSETKEKLLAEDETIINLKMSVKHLQTQLQQSKEVIEGLSMDKSKMRDQIKEEFQSEMNSLDNEVKNLKNSKEEELQRIFAKVKLTVAHKDELLSELTKNNTNLQEKCALLENMLEKQQKEYLIK